MVLPPRIAALLAVVLWGISFVATKAALREMSPPTLIFTRFALGVGLLLIILRRQGANVLPPRSAVRARRFSYPPQYQQLGGLFRRRSSHQQEPRPHPRDRRGHALWLAHACSAVRLESRLARASPPFARRLGRRAFSRHWLLGS